MSDYVTKEYLTKSLDSGFNSLYKKLTKHFDKQFDEVKEDIAELKSVFIFEFKDGKIAKETAYWSEAFEAPKWRAKWVEKS